MIPINGNIGSGAFYRVDGKTVKDMCILYMIQDSGKTD